MAFVDKSSATLRATSAIPLDGLEDGLLALQPFRFGGPGVDDSSDRSSILCSSLSPRSSSASSTASASSLPHSQESEDGGRHGGDEADAVGEGNAEDSGARGRHDAGGGSDGAREGRADENVRRNNERESDEDSPDWPPASPAETPPKDAGAAAARPGTSGSPALPSPDRRSRGEPRTGSPAARRHGWVRGRPSILSSRGARNRRSGSRGGGRSSTPTAPGCWVPPPTRWGGTPIKSATFWESWGEGSTAVGHARQGEAAGGCDGGPRSRGSMQSTFMGGDGRIGGEQESERDEEEEPQGEDGGGGFETTGEFFRTADGRSLFAESLGNLSSGDSAKRGARREIQWGEVLGGGSGRRGPGQPRGFLCLLGEEGCRPSERGAAEAKRLGVAARHRRARIDARSRDGKRRAETLAAREKMKRLEEEVGVRKIGIHGDGDLAKK